MRGHWLVASIFSMAVVGACSADNPTSVAATPAGMYDLKTINGTILPYPIPADSGLTVELVSDALSLNADASYTDVGIYRVTQGGLSVADTIRELGTYSDAEGSITFNDVVDGITYTGTLSGRTLTETSPGFTIIYQRR